MIQRFDIFTFHGFIFIIYHFDDSLLSGGLDGRNHSFYFPAAHGNWGSAIGDRELQGSPAPGLGAPEGDSPGPGGCRGGPCPFSRPRKSLPLCPDFFSIPWSWRLDPCGPPSQRGARPLWSPRARGPWSPHGPIRCIRTFSYFQYPNILMFIVLQLTIR